MVGFFHFSINILKTDLSITFVPFIFSNQSSLGYDFSKMRARGAGTSQNDTTALVCNNLTEVSKGLSNKKWYEKMVDDNKRQVPFTSMEGALEIVFHFVPKQ